MFSAGTLRLLRALHRWCGLAMAVFLVPVGLTGSVLAFYWELEEFISPAQFVESQPDVVPLDAGSLAERALQLEPQTYVTEVYLPQPGRAEIYVAPRPSSNSSDVLSLPFDEILLNPYTGEDLGRRTWGDIRQGWRNVVSFIYKFHYSLALGDVGIWILGITALVWTIDCFTGLIITLPARSHRRVAQRAYWSRWKKAWKIQWRASRWRFNFDLHRAASLWLWIVLLVFAWSSVYMNLWDTLYTRITASVMEFEPPWVVLASREPCAPVPTRSWRDVHDIAVELMQKEADANAFKVVRPVTLRYEARYCAYKYRVVSTLDLSNRLGRTDIFFDANDDRLLALHLPRGQTTGNTVSNWLHALHMARVFGMPYRVFVCLLGLAVAIISVSGVLIWWRRHSSRFPAR